MKKIFVALVALAFSSFAQAQSQNDRIRAVTSYHTTVGTATALAIPAASVGGNVFSWKICNDAVNTSTFLAVGQAVDVSTDGTVLGLGQCYECENCTGDLLKLMKVEGQAASNGYSVVQYRK